MRKVHHLIQGTDEWKAHRATPGMFNGSEVAAIMGIDPKTSRSELLRMKALGGEKEFSDYVQKNVIDKGHEYEALARQLAEEIIGDDLSPLVMTDTIDGVLLSVSLDGVTQGYDTTFEHKSLNQALAAALDTDTLPAEYEPQCEAGLMVSGATRCLFMASKDGDMETARHYWYESKPELRPRIIAACKQFAEDLANYQHVEPTAAAVAAPIESLPALAVSVTGSISLVHNLDRFGKRLTEFVGKLNSKPESDQDFADLDAAVKVLKEAEAALDSAEKNALAQTTTIADMCNLVEMYRKVARDNRLMFEKIVKQEKINRKAAIITQANRAMDEHIAKLNERIGGRWMPTFADARFVEAIAGLKSLDSMRDKVSTALANAKIEANEVADRIEANRKTLDAGNGAGMDYLFLVPDFASVCTKARDDFDALVTSRLAAHRQRETEKAEAAKKAEEARIAAAVEAERKAGEARAAEAARAAAEAEKQRQRDAITANNQTQFDAAALDQATTGTGVLKVSSEGVEHVPVENIVDAKPAPAVFEQPTDAALITEFLALQSCSPAAKKEMRTAIEKWEQYRAKVMAARGLAAAA